MRHRVRYILAAGLVALALAGCGSGSDQALRLTLAALATKAHEKGGSSPIGTVGCEASLRPPASLPTPGAMPAGSFMARIQHRGYLIAGVNAGFLHFGYLNPFDGQIEGFEIDLVQAIAHAIFGNKPNDVQLRALTADQRLSIVNQGKVDVVVDAVTITCQRRQAVDFSTVYYDAHQRVLVPKSSQVRGLQDLGGKRVCATAGTVPYREIQTYPSHPVPVGVQQAIDCLVELQQGRISAVSTDDAILLGFLKQDPYVKLVGPPIADAPYGIAISPAHPDFVRFVNGVLAQMRADGQWQALYGHWVGSPVPAPPRAQYNG